MQPSVRANMYTSAVSAHTRTRTTKKQPSARTQETQHVARDGQTAHTEDNVVTRAVFHAPMFALNADAW